MNAFATKHDVITPNDDTIIDTTYVAFVIVSGGSVAMTDIDGTSITYDSVPPLTVFENFRPAKILATGTTASKIVGWR